MLLQVRNICSCEPVVLSAVLLRCVAEEDLLQSLVSPLSSFPSPVLMEVCVSQEKNGFKIGLFILSQATQIKLFGSP